MKSHIHRIREELPLVLLFLATIWGVFLLDRILPLERLGLIGIVTMPFLHSNFTHLLNNSVPLAILLTLLAGSRTDSRAAVALVAVFGGVLLWVFGRGHSLHIGASGLVFGLAVFLIVSGTLERRVVPLLVSVFVTFTYGTTLLTGILPWQSGVSWDGHLFGGIAGGVVAWLLVRKTPAA
jgi:membrane associated rhomboid family serine protease